MKTILLKCGEHCLVDDEDFDFINQWSWFISDNGYVTKGGWSHKKTKVVRTIRLHRLLMNILDRKVLIDHINHNKLDNRKCNLRICNTSQNQHNRLPNKNSSSKYKGVQISRTKYKWIARIKNKHIGTFDSEIYAAKAYDIKARELFGEFALTNF